MSLIDSALLVDLFRGMRVTARNFFRPKDTKQYPEDRRQPSERFRGMFHLDEERCIKCCLCAMDCPIDIIYIDWHQEKDAAGKAVKLLDRFDIDVKRCMFCGLCEEACPTEPKSIWLTTQTYELASYDRNRNLYFDKNALQDWPDTVIPFRTREPGGPK